jgi:hypothetical protein
MSDARRSALLSSRLVVCRFRKKGIDSEAKLRWAHPFPQTGCVLPASIEIAVSLS